MNKKFEKKIFHILWGVLIPQHLSGHLGMLEVPSGSVVAVGKPAVIFWITIVFLSALTLSSPFLLRQHLRKWPFLQHLEHSLSHAGQLFFLITPLGDFPCPFFPQYLQFVTTHPSSIAMVSPRLSNRPAITLAWRLVNLLGDVGYGGNCGLSNSEP